MHNILKTPPHDDLLLQAVKSAIFSFFFFFHFFEIWSFFFIFCQNLSFFSFFLTILPNKKKKNLCHYFVLMFSKNRLFPLCILDKKLKGLGMYAFLLSVTYTYSPLFHCFHYFQCPVFNTFQQIL